MYRKGALSTRQEHRSCVGKTATGARDRVKGKPTFIPRDLESSGNDASGIIRKGGKKNFLDFCVKVPATRIVLDSGALPERKKERIWPAPLDSGSAASKQKPSVRWKLLT